jgi:hypothetical protein
MTQETILNYKRLEVKHIEKADEDILTLLENTIQGSEGGIRYKVQNIREWMKYYGNGLSFIALYKRNNLVGVIGLCQRKTLNCGSEFSSTFLRYLAVRSSFQVSREPGRHSQRLSNIEESFKHKLFSIFSNPSQVPYGSEHSSEPHLVYAYVESRNKRSINFIHQAGYEYTRSFLTVAFSRFSPSLRPDVMKLAPGEEPAMANLLCEQYKNYCFYTDEFSFFNHGYYVMKKNNEIVAGVCVIPTFYRIVNVPGIMGWIMMNLLPVTPYFRRLYKPGEFRFLVLSSIYCRKGNEHLLPDLFEAACASEGHHIALAWLDDHSGLYESLRKNRRMGAMNMLLKSKVGQVYTSFTNINIDERKNFSEFPTYISGFDFA